jgi:hypothetical protein
MSKRPPSSGADESGGESVGGNVADLDAHRHDAKRRRAAARLHEEVVDPASAIRAYRKGESLLGLPPHGRKPDVEEFGLPPFCPVRPLGRDEDEFFFLNAAGGVGVLSPAASGKGHIDALFAGQWNYLLWAWGQRTWDKDSACWRYKDNYEAEKTRVALFEAATLKGPWNMVDNVRGRGAWKGEDGRLILHVGDELLLDGLRAHPLGEYEGKLYPGRPRTMRPAAHPQPAGPDSAGRQALDFLRTWTWSRPDLDPKLMLGWSCAAMVGGALDWRPTVFATGDKGTGKSTLQSAVMSMLGETVHAVETTAAGIYQVLKQDSLPVTLDELEADADTRKAKAVIELARVASSGGRMLRGGQDHSGRQFDLRCAFLFSAINAPALQSQDRSRMAILRLKKLKAPKARSGVDRGELRQLGAELLRRVCDWWPRLDDLLAAMREALMEQAGHDGRGADTFGTLAAFAHVALSDDMPTPAELAEWAAMLKADTLAELEAADENWRACLRHLLQAQPDAWRTYKHRSLAALLGGWMKAEAEKDADEEASLKNLPGRLEMVGLGVAWEKGRRGNVDGGWLVVPITHAQLNLMFRDTKWAGMTGASGVWTDALRQADECPAEIDAQGRRRWGAGVYRADVGYVGRLKSRATLIRLSTLFDAAGDAGAEEGDEG